MEYIEPNSERYLSLEDLPDERWKPIEELKCTYLISTYARVKSLPKPERHNQFMQERIMKIHVNRDGYQTLHVKLGDIEFRETLHRLVAKAFIPNPNNYPFVLHKKATSDGGTNYVDNLYWGTQLDNMRDRKRENKYIITEEVRQKVSNHHSIPINQYDLDGNFIKTWKSATEVKNVLGYDDSIIRKCCKGKYKTMYNYQWKPFKGSIENIPKVKKGR